MKTYATESLAKQNKARRCQSMYKVLEYLPKRTLVEVTTRSGLRHQVRAQLASIGHPLVGDQLYQKKSHHSLDDTLLSRHFLHASAITFNHPETRQSITVKAPLAQELQDFLKYIRR